MSLLEHHQDSAVVEELVRNADIEIIPLKSAGEKLAAVPAGTTITVTCSAKMGLDRTLDFTARAVEAGYKVVPHLAARQVTSEVELREFVGRLGELGVTDLYVIGGDAPDPAGPYASTAELLEALSTVEHGIESIGVACYPEGHTSISDETLLEALRREQPNADYMVSQLCFDDTAITDWLGRVRGEGITLPLHLGIAGPLRIRKLAELSLKIGVGSSLSYVTKQHGLLGNVLRGGSYRPEKLLHELGGALSSPESNIERLHVFTFNQVAETVDWQARVGGRTAP